jgi:hypothetical protein
MKTDNELIAEFMGVDFNTELYSWRPGCYEPLQVKHLQYHNSWNWLMPVVEKITEYRLAYPEETSKVCDAKIVIGIQYLYPLVVTFIKWYNLQPK